MSFATSYQIWIDNHPCNEQGLLTHWARVAQICDGNLNIIGPDNGLSRDRRQAITRTNFVILLYRPLGTNFGDIFFDILIHENAIENVLCKTASILPGPQCVWYWPGRGIGVLQKIHACFLCYIIHISSPMEYALSPFHQAREYAIHTYISKTKQV